MAHKDNFVYTSLSLPNDIREAVEKIAYAQDRSVNKVCVDLIRKGLNAHTLDLPIEAYTPADRDRLAAQIQNLADKLGIKECTT